MIASGMQVWVRKRAKRVAKQARCRATDSCVG